MTKWMGWVTALCVPVVLVAAATWMVASRPFLAWELGRGHMAPPPGVSAEERMALAVPSTLYIVRPMARRELETLVLEGRPLYTAGEIDHLDDVKALMARVTGLALLGMLWLVGGFAAWRRGRWPSWPGALAGGGRLALLMVAGVGVAVAVAWPMFFTTFHRVFFPQGNWSFPSDSGLIRLFPEAFWFDVAIVLAGLAALGGALCWAAGRRLESSEKTPGGRPLVQHAQ